MLFPLTLPGAAGVFCWAKMFVLVLLEAFSHSRIHPSTNGCGSLGTCGVPCCVGAVPQSSSPLLLSRDPLSCRRTDVCPDYRTGHGSVPGLGRDTLRMGKLLLAGGSWASFLRNGAFELDLEGEVEF